MLCVWQRLLTQSATRTILVSADVVSGNKKKVIRKTLWGENLGKSFKE